MVCTVRLDRFKFFLDEWEDQVRSIEIKREGRLEKMYFVVPDWCRAHWKKTPVVEMRSAVVVVVVGGGGGGVVGVVGVVVAAVVVVVVGVVVVVVVVSPSLAYTEICIFSGKS